MQAKKPKPRPKLVHTKKLFDGKHTAEEVHRATVFAGEKCPCGCPPAVRAITFAPVKELLDKDPMRLRFLATQNNGQVPMVMLKTGKSNDSATQFVRLGKVFACEVCRPAMEKTLAKLPSWVLVEIDAGPGKDIPIVQVVK